MTVEELDARLKLIEALAARLDRLLFGNGRPGIIDELRALREADMQKLDRLHAENVSRMEKLEAATAEHVERIERTTNAHLARIEKKQDRILWIGIGVIATIGFLTGSGFATLHKLLEWVGWIH